MVFGVRRVAREQLKIFDSIIFSISIYMMNMLVFLKLSSDVFFHHVSMLVLNLARFQAKGEHYIAMCFRFVSGLFASSRTAEGKRFFTVVEKFFIFVSTSQATCIAYFVSRRIRGVTFLTDMYVFRFCASFLGTFITNNKLSFLVSFNHKSNYSVC